MLGSNAKVKQFCFETYHLKKRRQLDFQTFSLASNPVQNYIGVVTCAKDMVASPTWLLFPGPAPICLDEKAAASEATDGEKRD